MKFLYFFFCEETQFINVFIPPKFGIPPVYAMYWSIRHCPVEPNSRYATGWQDFKKFILQTPKGRANSRGKGLKMEERTIWNMFPYKTGYWCIIRLLNLIILTTSLLLTSNQIFLSFKSPCLQLQPQSVGFRCGLVQVHQFNESWYEIIVVRYIKILYLVFIFLNEHFFSQILKSVGQLNFFNNLASFFISCWTIKTWWATAAVSM